LAWLALGELDANRATALRAHVQTCDGCRRYLAEISNVTERLATEEGTPDIQATEHFHRNLMNRLATSQRGTLWQTLAAPFMALRLNWPLALPAIGAAAVVLATLFILLRQPTLSPISPIRVQVVPSPKIKIDTPPTIANYQRIAAHSLDELDDLLTAQSKHNLSPAPIYTVSLFATAHPMD
jgi:anti-sigma factor RsiW